MALGLALCGCGGAGNGEIGTQPHLRAFNGVNGTSSVAILLKDSNGTALNTTTAAALGVYSGAPDAAIPNENATETVLSSGAPIFTSAAILFRENDDYTIVAGGTSAAPYTLTMNDNQGNVSVGNIGFRAVYAGSNAGSVDVYVLPGTPPGVTGTPAFSSLTPTMIGSSSNASTGSTDGDGYEVLPIPTRQTYSVLVTAHGSTTVIATASMTVLPRYYYTAVVYDNGGNTAVSFATDEWSSTQGGF